MEQSYVIRNDRVIGKTVPNINYNYSTCPIGSIFAFSSERIPLGFFICDGASYKVAEYPDLYAVIGNTYGGDSTNFNVPDYRETVLVGVGENTTDTIASHDVYELGEFKDDQLQGHWHNVRADSVSNDILNAGSVRDTGGHAGLSYINTTEFGDIRAREITSDGTNGEPRTGTTTHGKQKGVTYIIKAFHTNEGVDSKNEVSDPIIEYVEGEVATKQENIFKKHITSRKGDASDAKPYCLIATLKTSNLTFVNEPIIIEGIMGNATSSTQKMLFKASFDFRNGAKETAKVIYGYVNQSSLFSHIDLITTFDESAEIAYIYVHHKTNYSIIDADISVPQRNAELYLTIPETFEKTDTIIGTEAHRMSTSTNVKVLAGLDDQTTSESSTWSSSRIAQQINNATAIKYDNVINANATKETGWNLAQEESHFYGRLLQLDGHLGSKSSTFSFLLFVKANYDSPTTVYVTQLAGMDDDRSNIAHTTYFELGVSSSGNLTIKNKSAVAASYRFI